MLHDNFLFWGSQLYLPNCSLRDHIIMGLHASGLAPHFERYKTIAMVEESYYWPKLQHDVAKFVKRCRTCKIAKGQAKNISFNTSFHSKSTLGRCQHVLHIGYSADSMRYGFYFYGCWQVFLDEPFYSLPQNFRCYIHCKSVFSGSSSIAWHSEDNHL